MYSDSIVCRFVSKIAPPNERGCLLWTAGKCGDGYGSFRTTRNSKAHRVAWELANGQPVPDGMCVRHKCDTPLCVNPEHLEIGTIQENNMDMDLRGRRASIAGEKNYSAVLNEERVQIIRKMHSIGASYRELSILAGVTKATIAGIISGRTWK